MFLFISFAVTIVKKKCLLKTNNLLFDLFPFLAVLI